LVVAKVIVKMMNLRLLFLAEAKKGPGLSPGAKYSAG
jgi:hypothetical protein